MVSADTALNGAGFLDAPCVTYYLTLRAGVPGSAFLIGDGANCTPVSRPIARALKRIYAETVDHRSLDYKDDRAHQVRTFVAELLCDYLDVSAVDSNGVLVFHGTTEAISVVAAFAALRSLSPVLPLPNYYAFDQSLSRHNAPASTHYSADGRLSQALPHQPRLLVDVLPNGIFGSVFALPERRPGYDLMMLDLPFGLPQLGEGYFLRRELSTRLRDDDRWIVCITPSKDLSIPGLRAGVILSNDQEFISFATADRFERGYSVHSAVDLIIALYISMLHICTAEPERQEQLYQAAAARFASLSVPFLDHAEFGQFCDDVAALRCLYLDNLLAVEKSGLFTPAAPELVPVAGYSIFRWFAKDFRSAGAYTEWLAAAGAAGLGLNPNYLFGGSAEIWSRLYRGRHGIRLNLSVPRNELHDGLQRLASVLEG